MLTWFLACRPDVDSAPEVHDAPGPVDLATPDDGWLRGDLHFHTNYSDDALEQGGDWMGPALDIAEAWADPVWTAAFPELPPTDHLSFVAVTDHRTTAGMSDPDFAQRPGLVVLSGEEFGSDGHAGIWGHQTHVPHEPQHGETATERIQDAIGEANAQGGLFSINHPLSDGDLWAWDTTDFDGVEVWNGPWSAMGVPTTEDQLDAWVADHGIPENPWIRTAVRTQGVSQNGQALRFWQAVLSSGLHVPPVGGGDRHMIFPAGLPTTYVAAGGSSPEDVIAGLRGGHTFVSRGPQGPQVLLEAEVGGERFPMGSELPAGIVTVRWRAGRANGGQLRLIQGALASDAEPEQVLEVDLASDDVSGDWDWTPPPGGGWLHAVVVDPLPTDVPPDAEPLVEALTEFPSTGGVTAILTSVGPLLDLTVLADPASCRPETWSEWEADCMPVDTEPFATFYLPPRVQALMSAEFVDGAPTGYAMGAISAAFLVRAP